MMFRNKKVEAINRKHANLLGNQMKAETVLFGVGKGID
jgi:hypothetical protein